MVSALMPRQAVPPLSLPLVPGGRFVLGEAPPERFDLLVFYRGLHCPLCAKYLIELERLSPEFVDRGVRLTAISGDDASRAQAMADKSSKPGTMEIWSRRGVTDRFVFRAAEEEADESPEPTEAFEE